MLKKGSCSSLGSATWLKVLEYYSIRFADPISKN
jgi:hypothetical protein